MSPAASRQFGTVYLGAAAAAKRPALTKRAGILRRVVDVLCEWRQRQADREIAAFIARSGRPLNDDLERAMTQCLLRSHWSAHK